MWWVAVVVGEDKVGACGPVVDTMVGVDALKDFSCEIMIWVCRIDGVGVGVQLWCFDGDASEWVSYCVVGSQSSVGVVENIFGRGTIRMCASVEVYFIA